MATKTPLQADLASNLGFWRLLGEEGSQRPRVPLPRAIFRSVVGLSLPLDGPGWSLRRRRGLPVSPFHQKCARARGCWRGFGRRHGEIRACSRLQLEVLHPRRRLRSMAWLRVLVVFRRSALRDRLSVVKRRSCFRRPCRRFSGRHGLCGFRERMK